MITTPKQPSYDFLRVGSVLASGWMRQQMEKDLHGGFAGCLDIISPCASSGAFAKGRVRSFEKTPAGMIADTPRTWWSGETEAVWLDGFVRMAYLSGTQDAVQKANRLMEDLLTSQDASGYIGIYKEDNRYQHPKENGEFWTQSRACVAMLAYYEITGKSAYLEAVEKAIALTMQHYGPHRSYFNNEEPAGGTGHGLMLVDVLEWLFRLTGQERYRDYGVWCYEDYCSSTRIRDKDNQLNRLLRLEEGFHWHTPHVTEHLRVPLWVAFVSGNAEVKKAADNAFAKIQRYLVPSGACIGDESIKDNQPTADMPYEYCAITELLTSLQSAYQKTGGAAWGDMVEWLAFNAAQGARLPDGKAISYLTRDNRESATEHGHAGRFMYSPTHEQAAVCCNPNAVKLLPYYTSRMWLRLPEDRGICAFCYGPSELRTTIAGTRVTIEEKTNYPFSETVTFHISPASPVAFSFQLRIPGWADGFDVDAGDASVKEEGAFCLVHKRWETGDQIRITFRCGVTLLSACNDELAVRRGPLLYALPIPEARTVQKEYGVEGLVDFSAVAQKPVDDHWIDPGRMDFVFSVTSQGGANDLQPWEEPPVHLAGSLCGPRGDLVPVTLLPMGCTLLRRVSFPEWGAAQPKDGGDQ